LELGAASPFEIVGVVSDKPEALGLVTAEGRGLKTAVVVKNGKQESNEAYGRKLAEQCAAFHPELIVLAGFLKILAPTFIEKFRGRIINIHPSLLPEFKGIYGTNAQEAVLRAGVAEAGCTVHYVTEEVDGGEIIGQARVPVLPGDTPETLAARILVEEHKLFPDIVEKLARIE
jgi:phosphoribosylglycinamide formyltransferase-1